MPPDFPRAGVERGKYCDINDPTVAASAQSFAANFLHVLQSKMLAYAQVPRGHVGRWLKRQRHPQHQKHRIRTEILYHFASGTP